MVQGRHADPNKVTHPQPVAALHSGVEEALHSEPVLPKLLPADMRLVPAVDGSRDSMHAGTVSQRPGTHIRTLLSGASNLQPPDGCKHAGCIWHAAVLASARDSQL